MNKRRSVIAAVWVLATAGTVAAAIINYKGIEVPDAAPTGAGGLSIYNSLRTLADRIGPCNLIATSNPTTGDDSGDGYEVGSRWINLTADREFVCVDNTLAAAVWVATSNAGVQTELTISSDAVTATRGYHSVDTQSDAASDHLSTINGGSEGAELILRASNSGRTIIVDDGVGNIQTTTDHNLDHVNDKLRLIHDGTNWCEVSFSNNGA